MIYDDESQRNSTTVTTNGVEYIEIRQISPDTSEINEREDISREIAEARDVSSFLESNLASRLDPGDRIKMLVMLWFRTEEKESFLI